MTYREPIANQTLSFMINTMLIIAAPVVSAIMLIQTF